MARWSLAATLAVLLATVLPGQVRFPHPTAVFTLDTARQEFVLQEGGNVALLVRQWVSSCQLEPQEQLLVLNCPQSDAGVSQAGRRNLAEDEERVTVVAALFRDLDETVYLGSCPLVEDSLDSGARSGPAEEHQESAGREQASDGAEQRSSLQAQQDCLDVARGETFTAAVEEDVITLVVRGRRLPLSLWRVLPKPRSLGDPYQPQTSAGSPSSRGLDVIDPEQMAPQREPEWRPPDVSGASNSPASLGARDGIRVAKTSLRTGRLQIECATAPAEVYIGEVYMGLCPLEVPLRAGKHRVVVRRPGKPEWAREFDLEAGENVRFKVTGEAGGEN